MDDSFRGQKLDFRNRPEADFRLYRTIVHMETSPLSEVHVKATRAALAYWVRHWDWEAPTLLGLSLEQFQAATVHWPEPVANEPEVSELAALGAVRELQRVERNAAELMGLANPSAVTSLLALLVARLDRLE